MVDTPKLRIFVSYSHDDAEIYQAVCRSLERAGLDPVSDADLKPGLGFTDQIQTGISHAHVFVPILTPRSHGRGWVHQEIGFAVALKVPYVPICVGNVPEGMIAATQGIVVREDRQDLEARLATIDFGAIVEQAAGTHVMAPLRQVAYEPASRARAIKRYADEAFHNGGPRRVRISGGLSSFSLPDEEPDHPTWSAAYGDRPRDHESYQLIREEHRALRRHAAKAGLSMVVNVGLDLDGHRGVGVTRTRLSLLHAFLTSPDLSDAEIAVVREHPPEIRLAVGDWIFAESQAARAVRGVLHTTFVAHAPTVSRRIAEFDRRMSSLLRDQKVVPGESRQIALERISARIDELPRQPS